MNSRFCIVIKVVYIQFGKKQTNNVKVKLIKPFYSLFWIGSDTISRISLQVPDQHSLQSSWEQNNWI